MTSASQTGNSLSFTYDALGRNLTQVGPQGTVASQWDLAGRRTRLTYPGAGLYVDNDYLVTGETTKIRENGATTGVGVLATYAYDDQGRRTSLTFGNGVVQAFAYDPVSRLASLTNDLASTANDLSVTFAYNPASQIATTVRTGDTYAWTGHYNENKTGTANGLNQLTAVGAKSLTHDARGNVTAFGTKSFTYSSENLLLTGPNATTLSYDPLMRLQQLTSGAIARLAYDGLDRIAEYDGANALQRRYVHGPSLDEPIVWYEGSGTTDRRFLSADERGSIVSLTNSAGTLLGINRYDEYGQPQAANLGAWGYTGQAWLAGPGLWHYKARAYDPELGRFLQTDPIGYDGGVNLYAYVGNDPINFADPLGLLSCDPAPGSRICPYKSKDGTTRTPSPLGLPGGGVSGGGRSPLGGQFEYVPGSTTPAYNDDGTIVVAANPGQWVWTPGPGVGSAYNPPQLAGVDWERLLRWGPLKALDLFSHSPAQAPAPLPSFPDDPNILGHIFSGTEGHYKSDTPANRADILSVIRSEHFVGATKFGVLYYARINPNGTQTWAEVQRYVITSGGLNQIPVFGHHQIPGH